MFVGVVNKDGDAENYYFPVITLSEMFFLKDASVAFLVNFMFHVEICRLSLMNTLMTSLLSTAWCSGCRSISPLPD